MSVLPTTETRSTTKIPAGAQEASQPTQPKPLRPRKKKPPYHLIHSRPLPLSTHPLPTFHPSNPLSLLHLCYTYITHVLSPPTSHPATPYQGYYSPESNSVHVTDPAHIRALWEMGFFGKGNLSRSEPTWLEREREGKEGRAAEKATEARREERRLFKLERARAEREAVERQRRVERGEIVDEEQSREPNEPNEPVTQASAEGSDVGLEEAGDHSELNGKLDDTTKPTQTPNMAAHAMPATSIPTTAPPTTDQEHLQLTPPEAFFLTYALGVLTIHPPPTSSPILSPKSLSPSPSNLLQLFAPTLTPDDPFLLSYVTYHHFRSLGWVIRPATKFGADYLLYNRGPVFSHAEFAVMIIPSYTARYWNTPGGRARRRVQEGVDWWRFHAVNRVQSAVKKTLVLAYVDVPSPMEVDFDVDDMHVGELLGKYRVREVVVRRWLANRSRD